MPHIADEFQCALFVQNLHVGDGVEAACLHVIGKLGARGGNELLRAPGLGDVMIELCIVNGTDRIIQVRLTSYEQFFYFMENLQSNPTT